MFRVTRIPAARYVTSRPYTIERQWGSEGDDAVRGGLDLVAVVESGIFEGDRAQGRVTLSDAQIIRTIYFGTLDLPEGRYTDPYTDTPLTPGTESASGRVTLKDAVLKSIIEFSTLDRPAGKYTKPGVDLDLKPSIGTASGRATLTGATLEVVIHFVSYEHEYKAASGRVTLQDAQLTKV